MAPARLTALGFHRLWDLDSSSTGCLGSPDRCFLFLCPVKQPEALLPSLPLWVISVRPSASHPPPNVPREKMMTKCWDLSKSFLFFSEILVP